MTHDEWRAGLRRVAELDARWRIHRAELEQAVRLAERDRQRTDEYLSLLRDEAIARLTPWQRMARHWSWFWQAWCLVLALLLVVAMALAVHLT